METDKKLDMLYGLRLQKESRELEKQTLIEALIPEAVRVEIAKIEEKYDDTELTDKITRIENEIREEALNSGETVKGRHLIAVYSKGRVSWDTDILDKLSERYEDIGLARSEGKPSISIRKVA